MKKWLKQKLGLGSSGYSFDSASVINLAPAREEGEEGEFIGINNTSRKYKQKDQNGWARRTSVSTDSSSTNVASNLWYDDAALNNHYCDGFYDNDRFTKTMFCGRRKHCFLGFALLALLGGVGVAAISILKKNGVDVLSSIGVRASTITTAPTLAPTESPSIGPPTAAEVSAKPTEAINVFGETKEQQSTHVPSTKDEGNSCPGGYAPFTLVMRSKLGDGWGGGTIKMKVQTLKAVDMRAEDRYEIAYEGTMNRGISRKHQFCLRTYKCYNVAVEGDNAITDAPNGDVRSDISWALHTYDAQTGGETDTIAYGGTGARCTFATTNSYELDGCPNTCASASPTSFPTSSPTLSPKTAMSVEEQGTQNSTKDVLVEEEENAVSYRPGELTVNKEGLVLSTGLDVRVIATSGEPVQYTNRDASSEEVFHGRPDFAGVFPVPDSHKKLQGGWLYTSNSEIGDDKGGAGSIYFDRHGNVVRYKMVLTGTSKNCGGGKTPWDTWISCEEKDHDRKGQIYEVDPFGRIEGRRTVLGGKGGSFESFAFDVRGNRTHFFVTEDYRDGALRRFTPNSANWSQPEQMLHGDGVMEYLVLKPESKTVQNRGTYEWTENIKIGMRNAEEYFKSSEGIDTHDNILYFVSKKQHELFTLDLDNFTWSKSSTEHGAFDGQPDAMQRLVDDPEEIVYFTEDGGENAGVHGRDAQGRYFTILESPVYNDETTGLAFSPDGKHMYLAYQKNGLLFDIWRNDGLTFSKKHLNIKYHSEETLINR